MVYKIGEECGFPFYDVSWGNINKNSQKTTQQVTSSILLFGVETTQHPWKNTTSLLSASLR